MRDRRRFPPGRRGQSIASNHRPHSLLDQRGQLLIPSLFVIPSLILFLFLILETAKLSREKIRHQFAVDAASFIEMTNYSDFLNRSAYVNGAFPQRIFAEGFLGTLIDKKNNTSSESLFDIMWKDGDFPSVRRPDRDPNEDLTLANINPWPIEFGGCGKGKNSNTPDMSSCGPTGPGGGGGGGGGGAVSGGPVKGGGPGGSGGNGQLDILTMQDALADWLSWDDANDIYNLYVQIYTLLGQVEDAQYSVWSRLSGSTHSFFKRSYVLNTGDSPANSDPQEGAQFFTLRSFNPKAYCIQSIMFYGNKPTANPFQPYEIFAPQNPVPMNSTMTTGSNVCSPNGLFHLETIPSHDLEDMKQSHDTTGYPGYNIIQHYSTWPNKSGSPNYFNVNFDSLMSDPVCGNGPCVHSTINLSGGSLWPTPTPKFQTRLYP